MSELPSDWVILGQDSAVMPTGIMVDVKAWQMRGFR